MAKTKGETSSGKAAAKSSHMKNFEERLERLEVLGEQIRKTDIPLDEAIKAFEEGIKLAKTLEQDLEKIESRIEILMNDAQALPDEAPELELFEPED
jgi:exodeoxyribonuclease VII small subunit